MLKKFGRFLSGRIQGTKGVRKYDDWMQRNKWASGVLGAGDLALAFYGPGLLGKGLTKVGKLAGTGSRLGRAATSAGKFIGGTPSTLDFTDTGAVIGSPAQPGIYGRAARGVQNLASYATDPKNALVVGQALNAGLQGYQTGQQNKIAAQAAQRAQETFEEEQRINRRAAELLMPLFMGIYGPRQGGQ